MILPISTRISCGTVLIHFKATVWSVNQQKLIFSFFFYTSTFIWKKKIPQYVTFKFNIIWISAYVFGIPRNEFPQCKRCTVLWISTLSIWKEMSDNSECSVLCENKSGLLNTTGERKRFIHVLNYRYFLNYALVPIFVC